MPITLDTGIDYLVFVNTEPIVYEVTRFTNPVTFAEAPQYFSLPDVCKRQTVTQEERFASGGRYTSQDRNWRIPAVFFPSSVIPKPGDFINGSRATQTDPDRWVVMNSGRPDAAATWRLTCRNLVLAYGLTDTVNIERSALNNYDAAGFPVKLFPSGPPPLGGSVAYQGLACVVQPVSVDIENERGIRGPATNFRIIVGQQLNVSTEDRVYWPAGAGGPLGYDGYLEITGYENQREIGEFSTILAKRAV